MKHGLLHSHKSRQQSGIMCTANTLFSYHPSRLHLPIPVTSLIKYLTVPCSYIPIILINISVLHCGVVNSLATRPM